MCARRAVEAGGGESGTGARMKQSVIASVAYCAISLPVQFCRICITAAIRRTDYIHNTQEALSTVSCITVVIRGYCPGCSHEIEI